jgi:hypothetical protein
MARHRLQIVWTVEVENEDALREHVRDAARGRLEPHDLAEAVADATSKDVTASLMDIAQMRLFSAGILFGRLPDETWVYPGHGG